MIHCDLGHFQGEEQNIYSVIQHVLKGLLQSSALDGFGNKSMRLN